MTTAQMVEQLRAIAESGRPLKNMALLRAVAARLESTERRTWRAAEHGPARGRGDGQGAAMTQALSPRELQIARLVADGLNDKAIAAEIGCSVQTVGTHLKHIAEKIGHDKQRSRRESIKRWVAQAA